MSKISREWLETEFEHLIAENPTVEINQTNRSLDAQDQLFSLVNFWDDHSIGVPLPDDKTEILKIKLLLSKLRFPKQFSAIYHKNSKSLEVIWTATRLSPHSKTLIGRSFEFNLNGESYYCEFKDSSKELLQFADFSQPTGTSRYTQWRNLMSFWMYRDSSNKDGMRPLSFWIVGAEYDEDLLLQLAMNLNFYLYYFDRQCPQILVHSQHRTEKVEFDRFPFGDDFPPVISAIDLDPNLVWYWYAAGNSPDQIAKFLQCYRILEYAAFTFVEQKARQKIKMLLTRPDISSNLPRSTDEIIGLLSENNKQDSQKINLLVGEAVDYDLVSSFLLKNKEFFCERTNFEGGYSQAPILCKTDSLETINNKMLDQVLLGARKIRHALAHGKVTNQLASILPTETNKKNIAPWSQLLEIIAGEVILNKNSTF